MGDALCIDLTLAMAPASLAATGDALHRVPAAASHLLIAKVMKFLKYFSDRLLTDKIKTDQRMR